VALSTVPSAAAGLLLAPPFWPQLARLFHPFDRGLPAFENLLMSALDETACLCLWVAFLWLAGTLWREWRGGGLRDDTCLVVPIAVLAAMTGGAPVMAQGYDFMRTASPLIAWTALRLLAVRPIFGALYVPASSAVLMVYRAAPVLRLLGG
jgi:hypothetical protein